MMMRKIKFHKERSGSIYSVRPDANAKKCEKLEILYTSK